MNESEVLDVFRMLAQSQGFYGRLLKGLEELDDDELRADYFSHFEDCKDALDVVMKVEGC